MPEPFLIGMAINLAGSVLINVGTNAIKYHHVRNAQFHRLSTTSHTSTHSQGIETSSVQVSRVGRCGNSNKCLAFCFCSSCVSESNNSNSTDSLSPSSKSFCCFKRSTFTSTPSAPQTLNSSLNSSSSRTIPLPIGNNRRGCCSDKSFYWWLGFILFFIGNVMNFVSFGFAAQSLLAGLGSIQFISNVVCSVIFMNQRLTTRIFCATMLIITGNLLIVVFASHDSTKLSVEELWMLYFNTAYRIYMTILLFSVIVLYVFYKEAKKRMRASILAGERPSALLSRLLPCAYAAISGIIGTQSVLLAKSSSELVRTTIAGENQFQYPFTYVVLVAWVASMVFWLYRMNAALRKFDGVFIIPVLQVVWTLFSIVGGGIYFREFDSFDSVQIGLFTLGVLIVIFGVYLLAPQTGSGGGSTRQLSSLDHSSDIEMARHLGTSPGGVAHYHHSLSHSELNSATNSPAVGAINPLRFSLQSRPVAALAQAQAQNQGGSSSGGVTFGFAASASAINSLSSASGSGSGTISSTSHLLRVDNVNSSKAALGSGGVIISSNRFSSHALGTRNINAYDDLDLLHGRPNTSSIASINDDNLLNRRIGVAGGIGDVVDSHALALESEDSFAITLSPAPHSMPVTPLHTPHRELEKRSRGMSLGFSMPIIDLENED